MTWIISRVCFVEFVIFCVHFDHLKAANPISFARWTFALSWLLLNYLEHAPLLPPTTCFNAICGCSWVKPDVFCLRKLRLISVYFWTLFLVSHMHVISGDWRSSLEKARQAYDLASRFWKQLVEVSATLGGACETLLTCASVLVESLVHPSVDRLGLVTEVRATCACAACARQLIA